MTVPSFSRLEVVPSLDSGEDYGRAPSEVRTDVLVDGINPVHRTQCVSSSDLLDSLQGDGIFPIFTCRCGDAVCGGFRIGMRVRHTPNAVHSDAEKPAIKARFERAQYLAAIEEGIDATRRLRGLPLRTSGGGSDFDRRETSRCAICRSVGEAWGKFASEKAELATTLSLRGALVVERDDVHDVQSDTYAILARTDGRALVRREIRTVLMQSGLYTVLFEVNDAIGRCSQIDAVELTSERLAEIRASAERRQRRKP